MEPCAPGTEDEASVVYASLTKRQNEQERILSQKAILKNGKYDNVFELSYVNGTENWYCRACECPIMGRVFQHENGRRHTLNLWATTNHIEKQQKEQKEDENVIEVAPGEPAPPGFEEEVQLKSHIQDKLDGFKAGPLVALEYLVELQDYDPGKEPYYLCILCDKRGDPRTVLTHLASYMHLSKYLQRHFPTCWRKLAPYMTKQYKRNWQNVLHKIAEGIEKKFGRLKPFPIEKDKFERDRMTYLQKISTGKHFSQSLDCTFEEFIVHEELTKIHEDERHNEQTSSSQEDKSKNNNPFQKSSPSPPKVAIPKRFLSRNEDNSNHPQKGAQAPSTKPEIQMNISQRQMFRRNDRKSLSSVSSSSSVEDDNSRKASPINQNLRNRSPPGRGRNLPYKRRRSPSPKRRSPSPKRRSPTARRNFAARANHSADKIVEREKEKLRKVQEFRKLSRAIENDLQKTLKLHEKNPEKHPQYNEEWKKFWNKRYKELQAEGVDASKYDFKPEWIVFWNKRMVELHSDELRNRKEALRKRLALPEEFNPIRFKINGPQITVNKPPSNLPVTALADQENDVIVIEDKDDDKPRASSPWEYERPTRMRKSPSRRSPVRRNPSRSPVRRSPPRSPVRRSPPRSPARKSPSRRSLARNSPQKRSPVRRSVVKSPLVRSRNNELSNKLERISPTPMRSSKERSGSRNRSRSRNISRDRSPFNRRSRSRSRETFKSRKRRSISVERLYEKRILARESSFERDLRGKDRIRTVADLPWEREKVYRKQYDKYYDLKPIGIREVTRKPLILPEPVAIPEEDDDNGEINVVDVLRILTALEDKLGSLGPKVIDLLAQALALEKKEANSSELLLDSDINCVLFETVKEKLKGQLLAGLVDIIQERAFKKAIKKTAGLIHLASDRKSRNEKTLTKTNPLSVPGVGTVDKASIAKQIANALVAQGKTDVTQAELEQLINAVVGMAEASKKSNKPVTTASFLEQMSHSSKLNENNSSKKNESVDLEKLVEPLTPSPRKNSPNMDNLSDSDLKTLLQNFKDLSTDEQHNLINYLKKLELQEPERVETLRQFVDLESGKPAEDAENKKKKNNRDSPFSARLGGVNPASEDLIRIESDEEIAGDKVDKKEEKKDGDKLQKIVDSEDEDYSFEDVVKSVSRNVKDKELQSNMKLVEQSMKLDSSKTKDEVDLNNAKDIISNLMSNIAKNRKESPKENPFGLGTIKGPSNSNVLNDTEFAKTFSNINVSNLANIVNSVKNFTTKEKPIEVASATASDSNVGKSNLDFSHLNKPKSTAMHNTRYDDNHGNPNITSHRFESENFGMGYDMERNRMDTEYAHYDRVNVPYSGYAMDNRQQGFHSDRDQEFPEGSGSHYGNEVFDRPFEERYQDPGYSGQIRPSGGFMATRDRYDQFPRSAGNAGSNQAFPRSSIDQRNNARYSDDRWY